MAEPTPEYLAETQAGTTKAVLWLSALIPCVFVALRCYVRLRIKRVFGLDDTVAMISMVLLMAYCFVTIAAVDKGLGRHVELVIEHPQNLIEVALLCQIAQTCAIIACTLAKTTFAITLMRIVWSYPWAYYTLWFIVITMNLINFLCSIFVFAQCKDPRHLWNPAIPSECWPSSVFTHFSLFVGGYSGAQDFVLALMPWTIIMRLQIKMKEKIGIGIAMSLGIFAGAAAIVKTVKLVALSQKSDFTWELPTLFCWAAAEIALTIVASSIPTLRPLLKEWAPIPNATPQNDDPPLQSPDNSNDVFYLESRRGDPKTQLSKAENETDTSDMEALKHAPKN